MRRATGDSVFLSERSVDEAVQLEFYGTDRFDFQAEVNKNKMLFSCRLTPQQTHPQSIFPATHQRVSAQHGAERAFYLSPSSLHQNITGPLRHWHMLTPINPNNPPIKGVDTERVKITNSKKPFKRHEH